MERRPPQPATNGGRGAVADPGTARLQIPSRNVCP